MALLDFPLNPQTGETYSLGTRTWYWDGTAWTLKTSVQQLDPFTVVKLIVSTSTNSTSSSNGAAIISGGIGIGQDIQVGGSIYTVGQVVVNNTSNGSAITTSSGAIIVLGGISVGESLYATKLFDSNARVLTSFQIITNEGLLGGGTISDSNTLTLTLVNTGVLENIAGAGIGVNTGTGHVTITNTGVLSIIARTDTAISTSTGNVEIWNISTLQSVTDRGSVTNKPILLSNTSSAILFDSAALNVNGGVSIGKNLNVRNNLNVYDTASFKGPVTFNGTTTYVYSTNTLYTDSIIDLHIASKNNLNLEWTKRDLKDIGLRFHYFNESLNQGTSAALILQADTQTLEWYGYGITTTGSNLTYVNATHGGIRAGSLHLKSLTDSISTVSDTGALIVDGGVSIKKTLYASRIYENNNRLLNSVTINAGIGLTGGGTITGPSGSVTLNSIGLLHINAGTDTAVSTSTGDVVVWNTSNFQSISDRGNSTTNIISILNVTSSTDSISGALVVAGGVGIAKNVYVNGEVFIQGSKVLTTGTIKNTLIGGIDMYVSVDPVTGIVVFDNTSTLETVTGRGSITTHAIEILNVTQSSSVNSGALKVNGGVGVGGNLNVGGNIQAENVTALSSFNVGNTQFSYFTKSGIASSDPVELDTFGSNQFQTVKYLVQVTDTFQSNNLIHCSELIVTHDNRALDTIGYIVQYGIVTNQGALGTWDVQQTAGILTLMFTPIISPQSMEIKVSRQAISAQ